MTSNAAKTATVAESGLNDIYFERLREHYKGPTELPSPSRYYRQLLARYLNYLIPATASVFEVGVGSGYLLKRLNGSRKGGCDVSPDQARAAAELLPETEILGVSGEELAGGRPYDFLVMADTVNEAVDVQKMFENALGLSHPGSRLVVTFMNSLWRPVLSLARRLGCRIAMPEQNWLAPDDVRDLLELAGWEVVTFQPRILCPLPLPVIATLLNRLVAPLLPWFCLTNIVVARPAPASLKSGRVSVVIPARNEAGNIEAAIRRLPDLGPDPEVIFVEGGSRDNTWDEILRVQKAYPALKIKALRQSGKGKGDAVRVGFQAATGEILMILDADLTMPPEDLPKFREALVSGKAEFANGVRLVYPMEGQAMRFLNLCANKFFAVAFGWLLGQPVKDTLCGTKVLTRDAYEKISANRSYFGEFDPFGDFDLLFGASKLNLKIRDIPIRYRDRTYGETNINRWRDGSLLFRMLFYAAMKLKFL
jgi:hypothetical protein